MPSFTKISPSVNPLRSVSGLALLLCAGLLTAGCREVPASGANGASSTTNRYAVAAPTAVTEERSHGCDQGLFAATAWECLRTGLKSVAQERQP